MFIERYRDLLKPGKKLITILDDTVLSSEQYNYVRDFIRENFIIKAVISLHGDAFQMAKARVKTALVYLEKKVNKSDKQPAAFMYSSIYLGVDDMPVTTNPEKIKEARELANKEIQHIVNQFEKFKRGEEDIWLVSPDRLNDRLDVKSCIPLQGRFVKKWKKKHYVEPLYNICKLREEFINPKDFPVKEFRILTITYNGRCKTEEIRLGKNINFRKMKVVRKGDLVFSEYNTYHGAIGFITSDFDGALASSSYTVVKCKKQHDALYLWTILRTTEIRADFLSSAIGMGRQTVDWENIKNVEVPLLSELERKKIAKNILRAWYEEAKAKKTLENIHSALNDQFEVESEESVKRFTATKPPK